MEALKLQVLIGLMLLAGWTFAGETGTASVSAPESKASIRQKIRSGYYNFICSTFGILPLFISKYPLKSKSLKENILKAGLPKSCQNLIMSVEYRMQNTKELKKKLAEKKVPVFWVVGGPGSGKGTVCKAMAKEEGYTHISVGDSLRSEVARDPESINGRVLDTLMKRGVLMPDKATINFLTKDMLSKIDNSKGFLIDGFPRSLGPAKLFQKYIKSPDAIIFLQVKDETMKERLLKRNEGRADDNEATIKNRLETFHKQQGLVLSDKKFASKVKEVDGEGEVSEVFKRFSEAIHEVLKNENSKS